MRRSPDSETAAAADLSQSSFVGRNRRFIVTVFSVTLILSFLVTLFTAPTYQAVAHVALPTGANLAAERTRLGDTDLFQTAKHDLEQQAGQPILDSDITHRLDDTLATGPSDLALSVESDNAELASRAANSWAQTYASEFTVSGRGDAPVTPAAVPVNPIRPKRAQQILFGGIVGLLLGFVLAALRDSFRNRRRRPRPA